MPPGCSRLYVILPDNFIIDLVSGSRVILDPAMQEFTLYCDLEGARGALKQHTSQLSGAWTIYTLKEEAAQVALKNAAGDILLAKPAEIELCEEL